jgi:hypothetical protein
MAIVNCDRASGNVTLNGAEVDVVTLRARGPMTVCNWAGTADLTVTIGATPAGTPDPVAGAADTFRVPAGTGRTIDLGDYVVLPAVVVKVIGNGNVYSVDRG